MFLSNPKAKTLKLKKKKNWTFSIITIHWAKPRSQKGNKCTDTSQNQSVYLNINTVTLIQISQKNKYKTKLEKKRGGLFSVYQFWIVDDCRLCEIQKPGNYFWVRESLCELLSPNLSDSICVCIKSFLTVFIFIFIFIFYFYEKHTHTHTKQTVSESLTEINNKQKKFSTYCFYDFHNKH